MDHISTQIRRENWRRIVQECNNREPGITKKEWCQSNGISVKSLYYWQRQFRNEAVVTAASAGQASFYDITSHLEADGTAAVMATERRVPSASVTAQDIGTQDIPGAVPFPISGIVVQTGECRVYVTDSARRSTFRMVMEVLRNA